MMMVMILKPSGPPSTSIGAMNQRQIGVIRLYSRQIGPWYDGFAPSLLNAGETSPGHHQGKNPCDDH